MCIISTQCHRVQAQGSYIAQLPKGPFSTSLKEPESDTKACFWKVLWGFSRNNSIQLENSIPSPAAQGSD